ncbi:MAG: hypothetical protein KJ069_26060 [Anaerolineae bacterium]|nr:hypothetical protein [Anaerolineae bacterium]
MRHPEQEPTDYELSPLAEILARQLIQRWDMHPRQSTFGGMYYTVREPLSVTHLFAHLRGEVTLGTYLLNPQSLGRFLVLDADNLDEWQQLTILYTKLAGMDTTGYLEQSRRGGHLWLFFDRWLSGEQIRLFGRGLIAAHNLTSVELYPKQDCLEDGPGSLIRLPFGLHRQNRKRYGLVTSAGEPLAPTLRDQVREFYRPQTVPKAVFTALTQYAKDLAPQSHFETTTAAERGTFDGNDMMPLSEQVKTAVSVRQFVGRYITLSAKGMGLCPFHDDHHPSFSVNDEGNYWHCFACNTGGSIIDFWMQKQGCDFTTAVQDLAEQLL